MLRKLKNFWHLLVAVVAVIWFRFPARKLVVVGVTGTDGKTTTATLIYEMLKRGGKKVALISTVAAYIGSRRIDTGLHVTTPSSWHLQKLIRKIVDFGYRYLVLEVTSHGLDQHRLLGTNIAFAVVTNITHEHLDYHVTFQNYVKAKARILGQCRVAVVGRQAYVLLRKYFYGFQQIVTFDKDTLESKMKGIVRRKFNEGYNQLNATAAILVARELSIKEEAIITAIRQFSGVEGRMQNIVNKRGVRIFIDFAHTPNALNNVLSVLGDQLGSGKKLIAVFGCAGERDRKKRPMMAGISTRLADISVFTAEDPRGEDINRIIEQMELGVESGEYYKIPDRKEAIIFAINDLSKRGDIVVICGKGHEKSMAYDGREYPWSDRLAVEQALAV